MATAPHSGHSTWDGAVLIVLKKRSKSCPLGQRNSYVGTFGDEHEPPLEVGRNQQYTAFGPTFFPAVSIPFLCFCVSRAVEISTHRFDAEVRETAGSIRRRAREVADSAR